MNGDPDTRSALVRASTSLFAQHGYDGTSIRAITRRANANLGAITYHFGSKDGLYDAVIESLVEPMRAFAAEAARAEGPPLDRIERLVRGLFQFLKEHPELLRLLTQHLAGPRPLPGPARNTIQTNIRLLASLIAEGQRGGSVRPGDPLLLALSIGAQPMWLSLARRALQEGGAIDQDDPDAHAQLVDSVVRFVRAGLSSYQEGTS